MVPAIRCCLIFLSVNFEPQGTLWLQLSGSLFLFVFQLRTSRDSRVSAIRYCLNSLSINIGPQGTLWLQLSGIVSSFRLSISFTCLISITISYCTRIPLVPLAPPNPPKVPMRPLVHLRPHPPGAAPEQPKAQAPSGGREHERNRVIYTDGGLL